MMDDDPKLTVNEAADFLGVSRRTIYNYDKAGHLRIGHERGKPFVRRSQIDMYLEKKKMKVKKTEFVPEGSLVVDAERYEALLLRSQYLEKRETLMLTYEQQIEEDKEQIELARRLIEAEKQERGELEAQLEKDRQLAQERDRQRVELEAELAKERQQAERLRVEAARKQGKLESELVNGRQQTEIAERQRNELETQLITEQERIEVAEQQRVEAEAEAERLKKRGLWARIFNKD